jgi:hypothetical protein
MDTSPTWVNVLVTGRRMPLGSVPQHFMAWFVLIEKIGWCSPAMMAHLHVPLHDQMHVQRHIVLGDTP